MGGSKKGAAFVASIQKKEWLQSKGKLAAVQNIGPGRQKAVPPASDATRHDKDSTVAASGATSKGAPKAKSIAAGRGAGNSRKSWLPKLSKLKKRSWTMPRHPLLRSPNIVPGRQKAVVK